MDESGGPEWQDVLAAMYRGPLSIRIDSEADWERLAARVEREPLDVAATCSELVHAGLLVIGERVPGDGWEGRTEPHEVLVPSEAGLRIAHDLEVTRREERQAQGRATRLHDSNRAVAFLTVGLVSVTLIEAAVIAAAADGAYPTAYHLVFVGAGFVLLFALVLYASGLLSSLGTDGHE